jgi:small subunit ribosomal protein S16
MVCCASVFRHGICLIWHGANRKNPVYQGKRFKGMVKIRLSRGGAKKKPFYHIVVADSRNKRDGRRIEKIGFYNPMAKGQEEGLRLDLERVDYWTGVGAQISERVQNLVTQARSSAA